MKLRIYIFITVLLVVGEFTLHGFCSEDLIKPAEDGSRFGTGTNGGWVGTWGGLEECELYTKDGIFLFGDNQDAGIKVLAGDDGYIYVAGKVEQETDLDPSVNTAFRRRVGGTLSKFSSDGKLIWGSTFDTIPADMDFGPDGNIYLTGGYRETIDLSEGSSDDYGEHFVSIGFLSCLDTNGNYQWGRTWGVSGHCIEVTESGRIFVGGKYSFDADLNPGDGTELVSPGGYESAYLSEFTLDGEWLQSITWNWTMPEVPVEDPLNEGGHCQILSISIDTDENIYLGGSYGGEIDFDTGEGEAIHDGGRFSENFLLKLDSDLNYQWVKTWGNLWVLKDMDTVITDEGFIFATGCYQWFDDFDPGEGQDMHEAVNDYDIYVTSFNLDGDFNWARTWGGRAREESGGVTVGSDGSIYVSGLFQTRADLNPGSGQDWHEDASAGGGFVIKFNGAGEYDWSRSWTPFGEGHCNAADIALDADDNIYVTGYYMGIYDFDFGEGIELHDSPDGYNDVFVLKMRSDGTW